MNNPDSSIRRPDPVSFGQALLYWLKLGFLSFGGPAGQIALMHHDLVETRRWISEQRYLHALNYCMLLPGPEAQQLATYIGWLMHRTKGAIAAGTLFVLPAVFVLVSLSWIYLSFGNQPLVASVLYGIKPAVTAIVLFAAYRIGSRTLNNIWLWVIAVASFIAISVYHLPFPLIIASAGLAGALGGRFAPQYFSASNAHTASKANFGPALIDDSMPLAPHTRFSSATSTKVILYGLLLWLVPITALCITTGCDSTWIQLGIFFSKAALLTFGGAYAVLPYVNEAAVEHYHWLTANQMLDGLALGETTPGPLIMVVTFVGFVAGWTHALLGPDHLLLAGVLAAIIVTYFTFLPSFVFILAGAPLVEATHGNLKFTAPLTAVTAAVVGVILNLAVYFAGHVFWPQGFAGQMDLIAPIFTLAALLALMRYKQNVVLVILEAGAAGLLLALVRGAGL